LWLVAAFLGGLVAAHYFSARLLLGGAEAAPAISVAGSLL
jgi:hypothetical protein